MHARLCFHFIFLFFISFLPFCPWFAEILRLIMWNNFSRAFFVYAKAARSEGRYSHTHTHRHISFIINTRSDDSVNDCTLKKFTGMPRLDANKFSGTQSRPHSSRGAICTCTESVPLAYPIP